MDDLVCVYSTGGVHVALARVNENGGLEFVAEAWKNDNFNFCRNPSSQVKSSQALFSSFGITFGKIKNSIFPLKCKTDGSLRTHWSPLL